MRLGNDAKSAGKNALRLGGRLEAMLRAATCAVLGDDGVPLPVGRLTTGQDALDAALDGGLPQGRLLELYGAPGSGKTALALRMAAAAQAEGAVAFIDVDGSFDATRAAAYGVDLERLVVARPSTGEQALQLAEALMRSRSCALLVLDSVAALLPRAELKVPLGEAAPGLQARMLSLGLRRVVHAGLASGCVGLFVNQTRLALDGGLDGMTPELVTAGGSALRFYAALRLEVARGRAGASVRIVKNRHGQEGGVVALNPKATCIGPVGLGPSDDAGVASSVRSDATALRGSLASPELPSPAKTNASGFGVRP